MEEGKGRGTARRESRPTGIGEWVEGRGGRTTTKGKEFVGALAHQRDYGAAPPSQRFRLRPTSARQVGEASRQRGPTWGEDGLVAFECSQLVLLRSFYLWVYRYFANGAK